MSDKWNKDEWQTPEKVLELVRLIFNGNYIHLDPATAPENPTNAVKFYTKGDNCLVQDWIAGNVFLNPPFSKPLPFIQKLCEEYDKLRFLEAIALVMQGVGCNKGTGPLLGIRSSAMCQWRSPRIGFIRDGKQFTKSDFNCGLYYFGPRKEAFKEVFEDWGNVWYNANR